MEVILINDIPVWQLPAPNETTMSANAYIPKTAKYHCFVRGDSLCRRHAQDTDYYELGIESGEILSRPEIACKRCFAVWKRRYIRY